MIQVFKKSLSIAFFANFMSVAGGHYRNEHTFKSLESPTNKAITSL